MRRAALASLLSLVAAVRPVSAQAPESEPSDRGRIEDHPTLRQYLNALAERQLLSEETGSAQRLRQLVERAETLYFDGRYDEASLRLFEVVESPRFGDFVGLEEFRGAEYMLAGALKELGALRTASRYLQNILKRGPEDPYFGPAMRRFVDIALDSGSLRAALDRIEQLVEVESLPDDARNEVRYLRGRTHYLDGELERAEKLFAEITRKSRFYANAQYLRGVIDARAGELDAAEEHFCTIADTGKQDRYSFYVDERYFKVKDLAWLALGRVAHEGGRSDDAFYYYFQVPQDSEQVSKAMFEAAWAMYEGDDHAVALDLLDQLEARFPESPYVHEASLLRGYVHLARCEFEKADELFQRYQDTFGAVLDEIQRVLDNPARQSGFYEELLDTQRERDDGGEDDDETETTPADESGGAAGRPRELLLSMLRVDPRFYELHADIRTLDAEAARAGRLADEFTALRARLQGEDKPRSALERDGYEDEAAALRRDIAAARAALDGLTRQLDTMREADAPEDKIRPLEQRTRKLGQRLDALERKLRDKMGEAASGGAPSAEGDGLEALLQRDIVHARRMPARVSQVRAKLVQAANEAALRALRELRGKLSKSLRRARIGRIDAVMGSKRRIEIQIESLAAGRFPAELQDPLRVQGLLRDDQEYWPYEGEHWADEYRHPSGEEGGEDEEQGD